MRMRKFLMKQMWRIQQSQSLIMMAFWVSGIPGIFYPYAKYYLEKHLGIHGQVAGLLFLGLIVTTVILLIGFLYDRVWKFWKPQMDIVVERNQFSNYVIIPRDCRLIEELYVPIARTVSEITGDEELAASLKKVQHWAETGKIPKKERFHFQE